MVLEGFLASFLNKKCMQQAKRWIAWKANKTLRGRTFFWCWLLQQASKFEEKSMKNCMFSGTLFLDGFWEGFGRVFGGQNPRFSLFRGCFFDTNRCNMTIKSKLRKTTKKARNLAAGPPCPRGRPLKPRYTSPAFWTHFIEKQAPRAGGKQILAFWPRPQALELRSITFSNTPMA